jgi:hypothetical protein
MGTKPIEHMFFHKVGLAALEAVLEPQIAPVSACDAMQV